MIDGKLRAESGKGLWNDVKRAFLLAASSLTQRINATLLIGGCSLPSFLSYVDSHRPRYSMPHLYGLHFRLLRYPNLPQSPTVTHHRSPAFRSPVQSTLNPHEDSAPFIQVHLLVLCIGLLSAVSCIHP